MKRFNTALVVGKFSPLHHGHEYLIGRALEDSEQVLIISYTNPEFEGCDAARRLAWLTTLYSGLAEIIVVGDHVPDNNATDQEQRDFCAELIQQSKTGWPEAVFTSEDYGHDFAAYLAVASGQGVFHVCVDQARELLPVSGTLLRAQPELAQHWVSPVVSAAHTPQRILLLGGESTGKTTLAQALSDQLVVPWVAEVGRSYCENLGGGHQLKFEDLDEIARQQIAMEISACESAAQQAQAWVVCDTSPLTTRFYSEAWWGRVSSDLARMSRRSYDHIIMCSADFDHVQDGDREGPEFRDLAQHWYLQQLSELAQPWLTVTGTVEQRVEQVMAWLKK